jgi:uncharacterized membrane protein YidH (DUF202 family)
MEQWNKNDWQGRRKEQYEYSAKIVFYSYIAIAIIIIGLMIMY